MDSAHTPTDCSEGIKKPAYQCQLCDKSFKLKRSFVIHMETHNPPVTCSFCQKKYKTQLYLQTHINRAHSEQLSDCVYQCTKCPRQFKTERFLREHMQKHMEFRKTLTCKQCNKSFGFKMNLIIHMETHNPRVTCDVCQKAFKARHYLQIHINRKHSEEFGDCPYKCTECQREFQTERFLREHMQKHTRLFKCEHCHKSFGNQTSLNTHQQQVHADVRPFHCALCDATFKRREALKRHSFRHFVNECALGNETESLGTLFDCQLCVPSTRLSTTSKFRSHLNVHFNDGEFNCDACGKRFAKKSDLSSHLGGRIKRIGATYRNGAANQSSKPFKCNFCGGYLSTIAALSAHYATQHDDRVPQFPCCFCAHATADSRLFFKHMRTHPESLIRQCSSCDRSYHTVAELEAHKLIHADNCFVCQQRFTDARLLLQHAYTEHGLACGECKLIFNTQRGLVVHNSSDVHRRRNDGQLASVGVRGRTNCRKQSALVGVRGRTNCRKQSALVGVRGRTNCRKQSALVGVRGRTNCRKRLKKPPKKDSRARDTDGVVVYECDLCEKHFKLKSYLKRHRQRMHFTKDRLAMRELCKSTFKSAEFLQKHEKLCQESVKIEIKLEPEENSVNSPVTTSQLLECARCMQVFSCMTALQRHTVLLHDGKRRHRCRVCRRAFCDKAALLLHKATRHSLRLQGARHCGYECDFCDAPAFSCDVMLKRHFRLVHVV